MTDPGKNAIMRKTIYINYHMFARELDKLKKVRPDLWTCRLIPA